MKAFTIILACALLITSGCGLVKDKTFTPSEAEKKLTAFCLKEGDLNVVTRRLNQTLWIYVPLKEPIFDVKPSRDTGKTERALQPWSLLSLQTEYSEKYFKFNYDVINDVLAPEPTTYGSSYNETYTKKRQLIYQALQESFFNAAEAKHDPMPLFVVIMVADITRGVATQSTIYLRDLRQYVTEVIPPYEYYMREQNEIVGNEGLLNDTLGRHVPYAEVTWTNFLTKQIETRIKYTFTSGSLRKDADAPTEMAKAGANTLRFYPFSDYEGMVLYDVRAKKERTISKEELKEYAEKNEWEEAGKLTTIHFQLPKDPTEGMTIKDATTSPAKTDQ